MGEQLFEDGDRRDAYPTCLTTRCGCKRVLKTRPDFHSQFGPARLNSPGRRMKKYWHVIGIGIQNNLTYRFNYLTRTLFNFIPPFARLGCKISWIGHFNASAAFK
jgi:hypothetical protein